LKYSKHHISGTFTSLKIPDDLKGIVEELLKRCLEKKIILMFDRYECWRTDFGQVLHMVNFEIAVELTEFLLYDLANILVDLYNKYKVTSVILAKRNKVDKVILQLRILK